LGYVRPADRLRGELTEFVGRRAELVLVRQALGSARLVTLIGPGGIGKTRLAIEAASGARRAFSDGVGLAELSGLRDPALLVPEVARSLGLADKSARWAVASLSDRLASRRILLVLDQCEHLADACAVMADALLRACPSLRIIATSRHVLGVAGEVTVAVPPMTVPADCPSAVPEELLCYEAVRLFADRAAAVLPGFVVDAENGATVAAVCRALDGIPLAIELAAVRLRSLSPQQVLALVQGDAMRARVLLEAALTAARQAGDVQGVAYASSFLGYAMYYLGEEDQGHALAENALELHQQAGDQIGVVLAQMQFGHIHLCAGEARSAADWFGECARTCESSGNTWYHAYARWGLGVAALLLADPGAAAGLLRAALDSMRKLDDPMGVVFCLDALAWIDVAHDQAPRALTLLGAADAAWAAIPATPQPVLREHHDAALAAARDVVPASAFAVAVAEGAAMSQARAIAYALGEPAQREARSGTGPAAAHRQLTRREQDVAALVARGLSNGEIAGELVISVRTVESHVQHIMDKLGVGTRAQIAAWSAAGR
jgi:DNA-binding CsgD family transcriptional regulator